jgi:hypothetical protein
LASAVHIAGTLQRNMGLAWIAAASGQIVMGLQQAKRGPRQRPQKKELYITELLPISSKRTAPRLLELFYDAIVIDGR